MKVEIKPILDPVEYEIDLSEEEEVASWRGLLTADLVIVRGLRCEVCQTVTDMLDLHEGIVTRGDVRGWPREKKGLIFHEYNCFLICRSCHTIWGEVFPREKAWEMSCQRYGKSEVRAWYEGLPWKIGVPRRFWDGGENL